MFDYYIIMSDTENINEEWRNKWNNNNNVNDPNWLDKAWELHTKDNEHINKNLDFADFLFIIQKIQFDNPEDVREYYSYLFHAIEELKESFPNDFYENFLNSRSYL